MKNNIRKDDCVRRLPLFCLPRALYRSGFYELQRPPNQVNTYFKSVKLWHKMAFLCSRSSKVYSEGAAEALIKADPRKG